jgi:dihydroneopterin aldolase
MRLKAGPTVLKLGGSHAFSPWLHDWVAMLAGCGGHVVAVPGGGPFADLVREAQTKIGFDDAAAHRMALLAMEQYGCAIASLDSRLMLARSLSAIRRALRQGRVPVWLPAGMASAAADIPASWEVTSDSLAAWLAGKLGAPRVLLVKQVVLAGERFDAPDLAARGIVDPLFPRYLSASGAAAAVLGPRDVTAAASVIRSGGFAGSAVDLP